jgi:hypothetical protein
VAHSTAAPPLTLNIPPPLGDSSPHHHVADRLVRSPL